MKDISEELNLFGRRRLPVVLGAEAAECGLVCITMIAQYYGHNIDLNSLRQRFNVSMSGLNLTSLINLADKLGFTTRALRVELDVLRKIRTPAILHWDNNHFVVLAKVLSNSIVIHDPIGGQRKMSFKEVSAHFTGIVLEINPAEGFQPVKDIRPVRLSSLWSNMAGFWSSMFQILFLSIGLQVVVFAAPFQLQLVIDEALAHSDKNLLLILTLGFGMLVVFRAVIEWLRAYILLVLGHLLSYQMIGNLVRHLFRLKTDFYEKRHVGDILSRINSATPIQEAITQGVVMVLIDGVMAIIALAILFFYSGKLAMIVLASLMLSTGIIYAFYPIVRRLSEEHIAANAKERTHVIESIRAAKTIKIMGAEAVRESHWRNLFAEAVNLSFTNGKYRIWQNVLQTTTSSLQVIIVIYFAGLMILEAEGFSVGMLFAFLSFALTFTTRVTALINQAFQFSLLKLHLERLSDIVHSEPDVAGTETASDHKVIGSIAFRNVSFRYGTSDPLILDDICLEIEPNEFVAFTGPSGGGKTTFIKLLLGLYPPESGFIELDGQPTGPSSWRPWRSEVGVVAQDDQLLSGSIADNIAFFDPNLDMNSVETAANAAQIHDDIVRMPMQYHTLIGDMGSSLSGGQRQRVLLARALYRNPKILILDEGTANLDETTETKIADLISQLPITRIIVAHRPALIQRADRVFLVVNRKIEIIKNAPRLQN